jgi:hypothetical protein
LQLLIECLAFDAAVIDVDLGGVKSSPAAVARAARQLPFSVVSGYVLKQQEVGFSHAPFIQKPCRPEQLSNAIQVLRLQV